VTSAAASPAGDAVTTPKAARGRKGKATTAAKEGDEHREHTEGDVHMQTPTPESQKRPGKC